MNNITYLETTKIPFTFLSKPLFYLLMLLLFSISIKAQDFDLSNLTCKDIIFEENPRGEFSDMAYYPQENMLFSPLDTRINYVGNTWSQDWHSIRTFDLDNQSAGFATINGALQSGNDFEGLVYLYGNLFALTEERSNRIYILELSSTTTQIGTLTKHTFNIIQSNKLYESLNPVVEVPVISNDGIEGITYNPIENDLFVIHETTKMLYRVDLQNLLNTADNADVVVNQSYNLAGDMSDASGLFFNGIQDASSDQLLVLSHESYVVLEYDVQYSANGNASVTLVNNQLDVAEFQPEGIVGINNELFIATEGTDKNGEFITARIVKFANPNSCNVDCAIGDIEVWNNSTCSCEVDIVTVNGCTDATACNFDATANCDDGSCILPITFNLKIYLEGPYAANLGEHKNELNTLRKLLPGQTPTSGLVVPTPAGQPYNVAPWNYTGTEGAGFTDTDYTSADVDWVLVTLRSNTAVNTVAFQTVGILQKNGEVRFLKDGFCLPDPTITAYYIVVEHRNHLPVMSPTALPISNNEMIYNFTSQDSFKDITSFGQKQLPTGEWAAYAGNSEQVNSGQDIYQQRDEVTGPDKSVWFDLNGTFDQYLSSDMNLDGDINGQDKTLWFENNGISSRVFHTN